MVGALEAHDLATRVLGDGRTAVSTDVVEGTQDAVATAHDDERVTVELDEHVGAGLGDILLARDHDPVASEDLGSLPVEDGRVVIRPRRQQACAAILATHRGQFGRCQDPAVHHRTTSRHAARRPGARPIVPHGHSIASGVAPGAPPSSQGETVRAGARYRARCSPRANASGLNGRAPPNDGSFVIDRSLRETIGAGSARWKPSRAGIRRFSRESFATGEHPGRSHPIADDHGA